MILQIIQAFYFILPAYIANMAPVFVKKINLLNVPVDFNKKLWGKPMFGSHKTWRGIVSATIIGGVVFALQKIAHQKGFVFMSLIDYAQFPFIMGFVMGFGAIFGDLIKSFFKRRVGIGSGRRWIPFDEIDFIVGALVFSSMFYAPELWVWLLLIIATIPLHMLARHIGFLLKICPKW